MEISLVITRHASAPLGVVCTEDEPSARQIRVLRSTLDPWNNQSLNREDRWGTTDDFATSFLHFFPVLHYPLGLAELQACPFPYVCLPTSSSV